MMESMEMVLSRVEQMPGEELLALFYSDSDLSPCFESRVNLFLKLDLNVCAKIIGPEAKGNFSKRDLLLKGCLKIKDGKQKIIDISKLLFPQDCCEIIFYNNGAIKSDSGILGSLSSLKISNIFSFACEQKREAAVLDYFYFLNDQKKISVLTAMNSGTFRSLMRVTSSPSTRKERKMLIASSIELPVPKLVPFCKELKPRLSSQIFFAMNDRAKGIDLINNLPENYRNYFYMIKNRKGSPVILQEEMIDVLSLSRKKRICFFKQFPGSKQFNRLSLAEQIDVIF